MLTALAVIPFLLFTLLLIARVRLLYTAWTFGAVCLLLILTVWGLPVTLLAQTTLKGFLVAWDIFFIIFGALYFLRVTQRIGAIETVTKLLSGFSQNVGVQIIFIAWFLGSFLEGTSGFGTPSTVATPLLISLGLSPLAAVTIAMFGNSASVVFGAAGTPIRVGLAAVNTTGVAPLAALINLAGSFVPLAMVIVAQKDLGQPASFTRKLIPLALFSGLILLFFTYLSTYFGIEVPSILGPLSALVVTVFLLKVGLFGKHLTQKPALTRILLVKTAVVYGLLIFFLLAGRFLFSSLGVTFNFGLTHRMAFFNPGLSLFLAGFIASVLFDRQGLWLFGQPVKKAWEPLMTIFPISACVQAMLISHQNTKGLTDYLSALAQPISGRMVVVFAPIFGVFGSFLTGSATVANLMFGSLVEKLAQNGNESVVLALALLLVGGGAGNMISLADIMPALAVANQKNKEVIVIKKVLVYCLLYLALVIASGLIFFR